MALPAGVAVRAGAVYPDAGLAAYVGGIGGRLVAAAGAGGRWRFVVIDDPEANAFALPDRRVLVTRGMLALAGDEAEVAAVLAHEIAHVARRPRRRRAVARTAPGRRPRPTGSASASSPPPATTRGRRPTCRRR